MPELEKELQAMRRRDQKPGFFPRKLNRVMLGKAEAGTTKYSEALCRIAEHSLYNAIRWVEDAPVFGDAAELAEQLARWLPRIYAEMLPLLHEGVISEPHVWRILIEEVFAPTFLLALCKASRSRQGNELSASDCWYLPRAIRGTRELPFQRVFQAWLNAAGCRGPEDVGKLTQSESNRKTAGNWLKGRNVPYQEEISRFVNNFKEDTARFADAQEWKGRLIFAATVQRICAELDNYFAKTQPGFSFQLLGMVAEVQKESIPIDCDHVLEGEKTFFVARMIHRRLKDSTKWKQAVAALPKKRTLTIDRPVTHEEMDAIQKQMRFELNPGNVLLQFIRDEISEANGNASGCPETFECSADDIFAHGIRELNRLLQQKGPMAA